MGPLQALPLHDGDKRNYSVFLRSRIYCIGCAIKTPGPLGELSLHGHDKCNYSVFTGIENELYLITAGALPIIYNPISTTGLYNRGHNGYYRISKGRTGAVD